MFNVSWNNNTKKNLELCAIDDKCEIGKCLVNSNSTKYCECPIDYHGDTCEKR